MTPELAISAITVREVAKGVVRLSASKPNVAAVIKARTKATFDAFEGRILPVDRAVAGAWGALLADSKKHVDDAGLAATALMHDLTVVTRNTQHFAGRGVKSLNPYKSPPERLPELS
jgi:predicted nucleic acid-binding protein